MRRCRLAVCAALAAAAAAAGILPLAQAASADSDIQVGSVTSPSSGSGALSVQVTSATALTKLIVHFSQGSDDVLNVSDFPLAGSGPGQNTFQVETPLTSVGTAGQANYLPAGTYSVTVDATDAGDQVLGVTPSSGAQFPFLIQQSVVLNPATIDYADPTVTFTGQVTEVGPGTDPATTPQPVPGEAVQMLGSFGSPAGPTPGTTDSQGRFSISAPTAEVGNSYQAYVPPSGQATSATSNSVVVTETADRVILSAALATGTIKYGQTDTVSGVVSYVPEAIEGLVVPLPGTTVTLTAPGQNHITAVSTKTGSFTAKIPAQKASTVWTVSAGGTPLLEVATQSLQLNVQLPTEFKKVSLRLTMWRWLKVKACLNVTSPGGGKDEIIEPVSLQYAKGAKGPWKKLATIEPHEDTPAYCAAGTPLWLGSARVPVTNGYYRLSFSGTSGFQPAVTAAVHRWRYPTKVTSFKVTPHQVPAEGTFTVSGRLWRYTHAWHPYADRSVLILFNYQGSYYGYVAEPKTDSDGYFTGRFFVTVTGTVPYLAEYQGDKTHFASASSQVKITITSSAGQLPPKMPARIPGIRRLLPGQ